MFPILSTLAAIGRRIVTKHDDLSRSGPAARGGEQYRSVPKAGVLELEWRVSLADRWLAGSASDSRRNPRTQSDGVTGEQHLPHRAPRPMPTNDRRPEPTRHTPFAIRHMSRMIARLWGGKTSAAKAEEYLEYLRMTGVMDFGKTPGNRGVLVLRRIAGDQAEFLVMSMWDSLEAIKGFAGPDYEKAVYYPEDRKYLKHLEPEVSHYEVVLGTTDANS